MDRTTDSRGLSNDTPPSGLRLGNGLEEEWAGEEILEVGLLSIRRGDVGQEDALSITA